MVTGTKLAWLLAMKKNPVCHIEKLMKLYYQPLFRLALSLSGDPVWAMTLTQRTFSLAFELSRTLPVPANVRAWLFAILFNNFLQSFPPRHRV
jgi:DNA-directed RNA polymerase specialized sigma24 family protein